MCRDKQDALQAEILLRRASERGVPEMHRIKRPTE
jgi:hypothetical protein